MQSGGYSQSASLRDSTPNNCSAVYQKELALLLIQASPHPLLLYAAARGLLYYITVIFFQDIRFFFRALLSKSFGSMFHSHQVPFHQTPGQKALLRLLLPLSLSPMHLTKLPFYFLLHLF